MKINADILAGVYESLRRCPPFSRWKLPAADTIKFVVTKHKDREGDHFYYFNRKTTFRHHIRVSGVKIGRYDSLSIVMAHEMIHLHQAVAKLETRAEHNADFKRRAARVCKLLGFDPHLFC